MILGIDEVGKGEIIGSIFVVGAYTEDQLSIISTVNGISTKEKRGYFFWKKKYEELIDKGLSYVYTVIKPSEITNIRDELIIAYKSIIDYVNADIVAIDDFGVPEEIRKRKNVMILPKADEKIPIVTAAAIIAKKLRLEEIDRINKKYGLRDRNGFIPVGSGNLSDPKTIKWLEEWTERGRPLPLNIIKRGRYITEIEKKIGLEKEKIPISLQNF